MGWSLASALAFELVSELASASAPEDDPQAASEKDAAASARLTKPRLVIAANAVRALFSSVIFRSM